MGFRLNIGRFHLKGRMWNLDVSCWISKAPMTMKIPSSLFIMVGMLILIPIVNQCGSGKIPFFLSPSSFVFLTHLLSCSEAVRMMKNFVGLSTHAVTLLMTRVT